MSLITFYDWLIEKDAEETKNIEEAARLRTKPEEFEQSDRVLFQIEPGDLVELGKRTQYKGEQMPKYGIVQKINGKQILVQDISPGGKLSIVQAGELYALDPMDMPAQYRQQLQSMRGVKNIWQKRTQKQRQSDLRAKARKEREMEKNKITQPMTHTFSKSDLDSVRDFLKSDDGDEPQQNEPNRFASFFKNSDSNKPATQSPAPLSRFRLQRQGKQDSIGNLRFNLS